MTQHSSAQHGDRPIQPQPPEPLEGLSTPLQAIGVGHQLETRAQSRRAEWVLRVAAACIFLGHGLLAIGVHSAWLPFFAVVGLSPESGRVWMPFVGVLDVALAAVTLVRPIRGLLLWMTLWAAWAALLRPLSGQSWLEFVERGGNWGVPLALLVLRGWPKRFRDWFR